MLRTLVLLATLTSAAAFTPPPQTIARPTALYAEDGAAPSTSMGAEAISALTSDVKTVFALEDIAKILPHRYPFLLVDKVVEYEEGKVRPSMLARSSTLLAFYLTLGFAFEREPSGSNPSL